MNYQLNDMRLHIISCQKTNHLQFSSPSDESLTQTVLGSAPTSSNAVAIATFLIMFSHSPQSLLKQLLKCLKTLTASMISPLMLMSACGETPSASHHHNLDVYTQQHCIICKKMLNRTPITLMPVNHLQSFFLRRFINFSYQTVYVDIEQPWRHPSPSLEPMFTLKQLLTFSVTLIHTLLCSQKLFMPAKKFPPTPQI